MKNDEWEPAKSEADEESDEIPILSIKSKATALTSEEAASSLSSSKVWFSTKDKKSSANSFSSLNARLDARVISTVSEKIQSCSSVEDLKDLSKNQPHIKKLSISEQLHRFGIKPQVDTPRKPNSSFAVDATKLSEQTQIMFDDSLFRTHRK